MGSVSMHVYKKQTGAILHQYCVSLLELKSYFETLQTSDVGFVRLQTNVQVLLGLPTLFSLV